METGGTGRFPYNIFCLHSADFGFTWGAKKQMTTDPGGGLYPAIVRDGSNVHVVWTGNDGAMYLHSGDGATTWAPAVSLVAGAVQGMPHIAVDGEKVHVIWKDMRSGHGAVFYKCNPTGNKRTIPAQ